MAGNGNDEGNEREIGVHGLFKHSTMRTRIQCFSLQTGTKRDGINIS